MAFNGAGVFAPLSPPNFPATPGSVILASAFNANLTDVHQGLTNCITRDGQSSVLADIPMGGHRFTGLVAGELGGESVAFGQRLAALQFLREDTGAVSRDAEEKAGDILDARDYGVTGTGLEETEELQAALDAMPANSKLRLYGTIFINDTITLPKSNVTIVGPAKIIAASGTSFEFMLLGTSLTNVHLERLEFDANQANRVSGQDVRFMGAAFISCVDCSFFACLARNTMGYSNIPAVGLTAAGNSVRCKVLACTLLDCGGTSGSNASDGVFTSGWNNLIAYCVAANCTDTAFVVESSNFSIISTCSAYECAAAGAVTNATAGDCFGNQIKGLSGYNWNASNTGGIQVGVPTATAGNLIDTVLSGIALYAETGLNKGNGAAINVRNAGSGKAIGVTISSTIIRGSKNQGILVAGEEVTIEGPKIRGTTDGCIQFQSGTDHSVTGGSLRGGSFGVVAAGSAEVQVHGVTMKSQVGTAVYAYDTAVIDAIMNTIKSPSIARYGKAAGATVNVLTAEGNNLSINNQRAGVAGSGSVLGSFLVYDAAGNTLGYVDYKAL